MAPDQTLTTTKPMADKVPKIGPEPTLLSRKEVDALYWTFEVVIEALKRLQVDYIVTGGSLLGSIRQHSLLFCDDDIDIAIIEYDGHQYDRIALNMQDFLPEGYVYQRRPWEGGDRVRPKKMNNVFIDLFTLRRYASVQEIEKVIGIKKNGRPQSHEYVQSILDKLENSSMSQGEVAPLYPCWHFNTRKAIEMWPKEVYREQELFPLSKSLKFGPLTQVQGPRTPVRLLRRAFGQDCFEVYYQSASHQGPKPSTHCEDLEKDLIPLTWSGGTWESGIKLPLQDIHFLPMQPVARSARRPTLHCRESLKSFLQQQKILEADTEYLTIPDRLRPNRTIYMDGVFDLFHVGHLEAIRHCERLGSRVIIGVTGDADATGYKRPPIVRESDRVAIVEALPEVDLIICPCPLYPSRAFMNEHGIDLVVHGFANDMDAKKQESFFVEQRRTKQFQRIPYYTGLSTTELIERVHQQSETPTPLPINGKLQWFGSTLCAATNSAVVLPFDPFPLGLRTVIEPHIAKAREKRTKALEAIRMATGEELFEFTMTRFYSHGCHQGQFEFDPDVVRLRQSLLDAMGLDMDFRLEDLHQSAIKLEVLERLTTNFSQFQEIYVKFVLEHCVPRLSKLRGTKKGSGGDSNKFYFQCFPCLRIVQPQEFSIGPHADVSYGHHPCSMNVYVPLSVISGSSSLYLERSPGGEDWHPIEGNYGLVKYFAGAVCLHWTTENTTESTRVSLDFRVISGSDYDALKCGGSEKGGQKDVYRGTPGYYVPCALEAGKWKVKEKISLPDFRVGFPWTVTNWEKLHQSQSKDR